MSLPGLYEILNLRYPRYTRETERGKTFLSTAGKLLMFCQYLLRKLSGKAVRRS